MPIVGFTYTKILVEKKDKLDPTKDKIVNNVNLIKVEQDDRELAKDQGLLNFNFEFVVDYGKSAKLQLNGTVLYMDKLKEIKSIFNDWEKEKKLNLKVSTEIFNSILFKCNIKALQLADDLNLPAHFKVPLLRPKPQDVQTQESKA